MDGPPLDRQGAVWEHHTNTFEKDTVAAGMRKHYLPSLQDPQDLDIDQYLLYSGLCQGLMYAYALDSMRYRAPCHGSLFWMYNDCWGEVGWTIVDYYLRRKPSWYFVRRAYAPLRLILRPAGQGGVHIVLANDTRESLSFDAEFGYLSLDGQFSDLSTARVASAPLSRTSLCTFERGSHDPIRGLWIARALDHEDVDPGILYAVEHHRLQTGDPGLSLTVSQLGPQRAVVRITAQAYAHAVHLHLPDGALPDDDYFDLLPGATRLVRVTCPAPIDAHAVTVTSVAAAS